MQLIYFKKINKALVSLIITLSLCFAFPVILSAEEMFSVGEIADGSDIIESPYLDNEPYVFPIRPGSSEWASFQSKDEMLAVCQIPENKLNSMTTEALLKTVLDYPLINDFLAFNTIEDAYKTMLNDFNGFQALFSRQDNTLIIINEYAKAPVLTALEATVAQPDEFFKTSTLEYLFACNVIANGKSQIDSNAYTNFKSYFKDKRQQRAEAGIYSSNVDVLLKYEYENANPLARQINPNYTPVINVLKTPKGNYVSYVYVADADLTTAEKNSIHSQFDANYPLATRIGNATTKYNCHSYAWHSASTSNGYWIDYPDSYLNDGSYYQVSGTPRSGMKIHYYNDNHSAISTGSRIENGSQTHWAKSKWGKAALYEHYVTYSPYASGTRNYSLS